MSNNYWSEDEFLRSPFTSDGVWQQIYSNFMNAVSNDPVQNLSTVLQNDILRLQDMGISQPSDLLALQFELQQAGDFGSLAERAGEGTLGQGWSSLSDIKLLSTAEGHYTITGLVDADALLALDAYHVAQYSVSQSLGKVIGQDGSFVAGGALARPEFSPNRINRDSIE